MDIHHAESHGWESSRVVPRQISDAVGEGMPLGPGGPCDFAVRNCAEPYLTLPWGDGSSPSPLVPPYCPSGPQCRHGRCYLDGSSLLWL